MVNNDCATCKHAKLDDRWGEYKCLKYRHKIYHLRHLWTCDGYEKKRREAKQWMS